MQVNGESKIDDNKKKKRRLENYNFGKITKKKISSIGVLASSVD